MNKQKFVRMHICEANPMKYGEFRKQYPEAGRATRPMPEDEDGYVTYYPDGYVSWCPKKPWEEAGRPVDGMTFGMAIEMMMRGKKVARKGWNGEGQFVRFEEVCVSHTGEMPTNFNELIGEVNTCFVFHYKNRHTGETGIQVGWLASQGDMKAEDWEVVE